MTPGPDAHGRIEALSLWAGQGVGSVAAVKPAGEIVREIGDDARTTIRGLAEGG
jgi:nitronate monooxygenase